MQFLDSSKKNLEQNLWKIDQLNLQSLTKNQVLITKFKQTKHALDTYVQQFFPSFLKIIYLLKFLPSRPVTNLKIFYFPMFNSIPLLYFQTFFLF